MVLIDTHLNAGVILVVTVYSDRYIISLSPHLHTPFSPFSPSLISLVVSVDVKHRVYLLASLHVLVFVPTALNRGLGARFDGSLPAPLFGTLLQTLPDLVTPLTGYSLSPRSCPPTRSAPSERFGY